MSQPRLAPLSSVTRKAAAKRERIVSMPCVDAFLRLSPEKQAKILLPGVRKASLELGVTLPWKALTGLDGINLGVDRFGASAPWERLQEEFGVTPRQVLAAAKSRVVLGEIHLGEIRPLARRVARAG